MPCKVAGIAIQQPARDKQRSDIVKTKTSFIGVFLAFAALLAPVAHGQQAKPSLDVLEMKSVPDGHYVLNLQSVGPEQMLNIQVRGDSAQCVNSSDPELKGLEGRFQLIGNGVFLITLRNPKRTISQWWLFRKDGSATVREMPDRGEQQRVVPVRDDSLEVPKESPINPGPPVGRPAP
jgi:hypothetical protein